MDAAGFQEVHFPAMLPKEPYEETNRWSEYGPELFRLQDRKGADYLLGPTHEEMFTLMVKGEYSSYKDLPLSLYQIQTKYRDEPRPRSGIIRGREFVMKDSYSFDIDDAGLDLSYKRHRDAYVKTFKRLGLNYNIVSAMAGAMGGSKSEEFLTPCPTGEDTYVLCEKCGYAANVEAMKTVIDAPASKDIPALEVLDTPNTPTIDSLVEVLNSQYGGGYTGADTLKNVMLMADDKAIAVLVPGDREVDLKRLLFHSFGRLNREYCLRLIALRFNFIFTKYVPQAFFKCTECRLSALTFKSASRSCLRTSSSFFSRWSSRLFLEMQRRSSM